MKSVIIIVLLVMCGYLADRLVRTENQRYALFLNMCEEQRFPELDLPDFKCLDAVQTRTSWVWQLFYGLTEPMPPVPL